jgi:regulator of protease activity HflC (stomatin/prohibitin superfamily)
MVQLFVVALIIAGVFLKMTVHILKEYERGVVFFLGQYQKIAGPGLVILIPFVQKIVVVDQRTIPVDIPTQDVITKDNVSIKVNAVVYYRVVDAMKAVIKIVNFDYGTNQLAQTTLRSVCGEAELDELLSNRDELSKKIQQIIDAKTDPWGVKVETVEIKHIDLPVEMQRSMAKQAEAERERRAKVIQAEGEFQASEKLTAAAKVMSEQPMTIQLRYLETVRDIGAEHNSTVVFPIPLELLDALKSIGGKSSSES